LFSGVWWWPVLAERLSAVVLNATNHLERWLIEKIDRNAETILATGKKLVFPFCLYEACMTGKMQAHEHCYHKKLQDKALLHRGRRNGPSDLVCTKIYPRSEGAKTTSIN
jgi:hypothetical protein